MADRFWVGDSGTWSDYTNHWSATSGGAGGASEPTSSDSIYFDDKSFTTATPTVTQAGTINCLDFNCILSDIPSGTPTVFESANTAYISVSMISTDKALVTYRDNGNSSYGTACVLSISGTTITAGTPVVFESAEVSYTSVSMISTDKALVVYSDAGNSSYGTACVLSVSGTTITAGTPATFDGLSGFTSVATIDTDKAIVVYQDSGNSGYGTACVLSVSGTTITAGTPAVFESAEVSYTSIATISTDKAIVTYQDVGNSNYGTSCVLSVSGTTITSGTPKVFESDDTYYTSVAMIDTNKAIVTYSDVGNSAYGTTCILTISGTTITSNTPSVFESAEVIDVSVCMLSTNKAIVTYRDSGNSGYGTTCVLSISGTTITVDTTGVFESASTYYTSVAIVGTDKSVVVYDDAGNSSYGTSCILSLLSITPTFYSNISAYNINVYGNLNISAKINFTGTYGGNFCFKATSAGKTIKTDGSIFYKLYFDGVGGEWTFQDDVYTSDLETLDGADTTLDLASYTINISKNFIINSSATLTCGTSTIIMSGNNVTFNGGGKTYNDVSLTGNSILIIGSNTYSDLKFTAGKIVTITAGSNQTLATMSGNGTAGNLIELKSSIFGIPFTITDSTLAVTVSYYSITDCTAVGVLFTANYSVNVGGNTDWIFPADTDYTRYDSIYRGNALHVFNVDKNTWFAWKENITSIQEGYDETIFIRDIDGFNYEQSETYYTRDRDITNAGVYVDIPWEFITKSYMGGISQKQTLTDISLHYKCSTNATLNVGYSEQSTNLLSTSFHSLAATSDFTIDNKDHIKRILIPSTALQNVDYYNLRFNGTGKFTLYGMEQNFRVKKR